MSVNDWIVLGVVVLPIVTGLCAFAAAFGYSAGRVMGIEWFGVIVVNTGRGGDGAE